MKKVKVKVKVKVGQVLGVVSALVGYVLLFLNSTVPSLNGSLQTGSAFVGLGIGSFGLFFISLGTIIVVYSTICD